MAEYTERVKKIEAQAQVIRVRPVVYLRLTLAHTLMQLDDLRRDRDELREVIYRLKFEDR